MAETDGLLLNFSLGDGLLSAKQTFKGGRWKDRLTARKVAKHRQQKRDTPVTKEHVLETAENLRDPNGPTQDDGGPYQSPYRASKRQRVDDENHEPANRAEAQSKVPRSVGPSSTDRPGGKPREVVSSLFTYNPKSSVPPAKPQRDVPTAEPSNAPLPDGLSTFTNLGLSTSLSTLLSTKMELKAPTAIQKATIAQLLKEDSDAFIQAETGSGKTLAYLLPIVQKIMASTRNGMEMDAASGDGKMHRDSGLFAIILSPTRELCRQISAVLERLLRCAHWIVASTVIGGEKKKSEKARLRKGLNILVATPGRLADHLSNTKVLDVSQVRWLVLDEGDRLMELGFEEEIQGIVSKIEERSRISRSQSSAVQSLPGRRVTILCSATMKMNVLRLGEISLKNAVHLQGEPSDKDETNMKNGSSNEAVFSAPAQLKQSYAIVPAKLRLVTLTAILKRAFARRGSVMKAIIFFSCADSVDFHFALFSRHSAVEATKKDTDTEASDSDASTSPIITPTTTTTTTKTPSTTIAASPLVSAAPNTPTIYKLHGSLAQPLRTSTLQAFTSSKEPSILLCTDVASRGLDLPNVDYVLEYDPPFSSDDHLHRVGRTARAGKEGRAMIFLQPGPEENYVSILREGYRDGGLGVIRHDAEQLLRKGFYDGSGANWDDRATAFQLDVERWALANPRCLELARRGFQSHVRAYATHVARERAMFDVKRLHLGHVAKSFALRDKPGSVGVPGMRGAVGKGSGRKAVVGGKGRKRDGDGNGKGDGEAEVKGSFSSLPDGGEGKRKMRAKLKEHMSAASEFNIG
ncbi:MAG: ATP-dependent RNA helicase dbp7 [Caeruleum heppii]|nr:MAG: ATP-dependent RNA helicase dbp7 [Caeruleum heppii]